MRLVVVLLLSFGLISCGSDDLIDLIASGGSVASCNDPAGSICSTVDYGNDLLGQIGRSACEDDESGEGLELVESCPAANCIASCESDFSSEGDTFTQILYYYDGDVSSIESSCTAISGVFSNTCNL